MDRPAAKQRPKAPLYPRPIPDFVVEELPPGPEDTAWDVVHPRSKQSEPNDNASNDPEAEQRAAKRRRIEACATAYLRGESLYIMTAQLKGPFEDGWRNPWARKRKHTTSKPIEEGVSVEIPETAKKVLSSFTQEKANVVPVTTPESRPASRSSVHRRPGLRSAPVDQAPSPFTSKVQKLLPVPSPQVPTEVKENRVKEWLRTNETYGSPSEVLVHSSPTPATRKRQVSGNAQHEGGLLRASQSDPVRTNSRNKTLNDSVLVQDRNTSRLSEAGAMLQKLSKDIQTIVSEPTSKPTADLEDEVRKLTNCEEIPAKLSDDSRAEFAINKAKLSALQSVPAVAHMSPFEFRKVPGKNNKIGNDFDAISGSDNIAVEPGIARRKMFT
ncbi:hypothetical protein Dsin_033176 [Dipteronia sinensis]|uniref:Uncharacterized protein n=1 Tax=Dipteronia sinensis TaxID=43782 RepID=A0AAE0DMU4_9ROSI|nr:hypothetical protein Dsin_033176 [Dipteronia sinensis]